MTKQQEADLPVSLKQELTRLQYDFAMIDYNDYEPGKIKLTSFTLDDIKIRMDGNNNHGRPHVHIDYGTEYHTASYAIDTGRRLIGNLDKRYDRKMGRWIMEFKPKLLDIWAATQAGGDPHPLTWELQGSLH